jgi:hypothetical protein
MRRQVDKVVLRVLWFIQDPEEVHGQRLHVATFLGCGRVLTSSDVWFLGKCCKVSPEEEESGDSESDSGHAAFLQDFSSRIWITYRKG